MYWQPLLVDQVHLCTPESATACARSCRATATCAQPQAITTFVYPLSVNSSGLSLLHSGRLYIVYGFGEGSSIA